MAKKESKKKSHMTPKKIKAIILSIVIAIVLTSFVIYLIQSIYPSPEWEDYCEGGEEYPRAILKEDLVNESSCEAEGGVWDYGYCDYYSECREEYETAEDKYDFVVFIVAVITGLIAISVGIILALPSVSSGLMLGGTFLTFYGTAIYWSNLTNWLRTGILGIVLGILIWLGYKKLES